MRIKTQLTINPVFTLFSRCEATLLFLSTYISSSLCTFPCSSLNPPPPSPYLIRCPPLTHPTFWFPSPRAYWNNPFITYCVIFSRFSSWLFDISLSVWVSCLSSFSFPLQCSAAELWSSFALFHLLLLPLLLFDITCLVCPGWKTGWGGGGLM